MWQTKIRRAERVPWVGPDVVAIDADVAHCESVLDEEDLKSVIDFFLLLKEWDTLSTHSLAAEPTFNNRVAA
jgi:hypothetical protein